MTRHPALQLEAATVRYGATVAVDGVSLEIARGEAVAVLGPSGAGKTTLLRLFNGMVRPTGGRVRVAGRALHEVSPGELRRLRARIGFVPQDLALVPELRVVQNVLTGRAGLRSLAGTLRDLLAPSRESVREVHALLERVGIAEKLYRRTSTLSGGQQQRVAIARALFQGPDVLIADEPVSSVDPARAQDTLGLLLELGRERGIPIVASLHDVGLARALFPRLVGMRNGRVTFDTATAPVDDAAVAELFRLPGEGAS